MTQISRGGNFGLKSVKLMYFLINLLLYSKSGSIQTKCIVMMSKKGSPKNVNFMTPKAGNLVPGRGQITEISHIVKNALFL